jgi:hypothetical protein
MVKGINVFPVRHHSPASSLLVSDFMKNIKPRLILIEGPSDANHLIEILTDAETEPPVAILAYYLPAGESAEPQHILYPFANYSPEYVALKQAKALNIKAQFVDIPSSIAIQFYEKYEQMIGYEELFNDIVAYSGYRSFEEFWEASFENGGMTVAGFITSMLDYARLLRLKNEHPSTSAFSPELVEGSGQAPSTLLRMTAEFQKDQLRERFMGEEINKFVSEGYKPEEILLVCGAFHAAAFTEGNVGVHPEMSLPQEIKTELTVIPYSYPRLSEQLGYGAGNRAPLYYEKVYQHHGDFSNASLETMVTFMNYLHFQGYGVSLADVIEANRLAKILAGMRDKRAPGLEEIREALTACLLHGSSEVVDKFLWDLLIGRSVGKVSSKIGKTSLQQEFYREVNQRKIPLTDSLQEFILHLTNKTEISTSIFLHRLRLCQIPFAQNKETVASAYDYLAQVREKWQVQWTPAVDASLVEKSLWGNSLLEVCARTLAEKLKAAQNAQDAAEVLLEIAVCDVKGLFQNALSACDFLSSEDNDFFSLAKACQNLQALISYGSSREMKPEDFTEMLTRTFNRAVLILPTASKVSDDAVEQVCTGLTILSDLCSRSGLVNRELFYATVRELLDSYTAHPKLVGLAASLAYLSKRIEEEDLITIMNQRLSSGNSALNGAFFLDGFLSLNKIVLVRNLTLVKMLDNFVQSIRPEDFVTTLPVLRRMFSELTKSELNYFIENLSSVYKIVEAKVVKAEIEGQAEKLKELDKVSQALDELF